MSQRYVADISGLFASEAMLLKRKFNLHISVEVSYS